MAQVHAIRDGLDTTLNDLDQLLKNQGRQVNLVIGLNLAHESIVNLVHCGVLRPYRSKK